jgi:hypothetical protein
MKFVVVFAAAAFAASAAEARTSTPIPGDVSQMNACDFKQTASRDGKCWCRPTKGKAFCTFAAECSGNGKSCVGACNQ